MQEPSSDKRATTTKTDALAHKRLDAITRELGFYEGPPIWTLPAIVLARVLQILQPALDAKETHFPGNYLRCEIKPLVSSREQSGFAEESIVSQYEAELALLPAEPLEYIYKDFEVTVSLKIKTRPSVEATHEKSHEVLLCWPEELVKSFESDVYHEAVGTYLSYDLVRASKQIALPLLGEWGA